MKHQIKCLRCGRFMRKNRDGTSIFLGVRVMQCTHCQVLRTAKPYIKPTPPTGWAMLEAYDYANNR